MQNMPIGIFRGDDTDAFSYQTIVGTINTDLDLTGCRAVFRYLGFSVEFDPIPEDKKLTVVIPADETKKFPPGLGYASLRVYDSEGRLKTFSNRIMVFVATKTPMFGSDEFEVDFNVRASLEPLKFFVGPNPDDFDEYRGYVEKVIDRASAEKYGLAILLDAIDSDLGAADGVAATPVAVKAAYAAIIDKLTDDYYTAEQTDEAIDRVAAYYITYDAAGNPFPTYAALANAQTVYSGGEVRVPTRNDYCVVLADETHDNAEYRYIYAVAEGQTTGSWQPQFPVEGVMTVDPTVTRNSQNPVSGGGVWSAIWGVLAALPTGVSSLYDWCVAQLGLKRDYTDLSYDTTETVEVPALHATMTSQQGGQVIVEYDLLCTEEVPDPPQIGHSYAWKADGAAFYVIQGVSVLQTTWVLYSYTDDALGGVTTQNATQGFYPDVEFRPSNAVITIHKTTAQKQITTEDELALKSGVPAPSTATPAMDGTGAAGSSAAFARGDHVHPTDTSRMAASATGADIAVSGTDATKIDAALAGKASKSDVDPLLFAQYYPDGNVKSAAEFTPGIKYDDPDTINRTITVKPFCGIDGTAENDNSSLVGRVVIPPFVDASGNGYISDDGTRFKVIAVSGGEFNNANQNLTAIIAPSTVTAIGGQAFTHCTSLTTVSLPAATGIGASAFSSCTSLTSVSLPGATSIRSETFYYCTALTSVSLPAATTVGTYAFDHCTTLASVSLPVATTIGNGAFYFCAALTSVSLPAATDIGDDAFDGCSALTSVDFGDTPRPDVPTLDTNAFNSVPTSCKIIVPDAQYDAWIAASGWSALYANGYKFLKHSEWEYARKYEVVKKADKPTTFTTGNLAKLDSNGNPTDSGIKPSAKLDSTSAAPAFSSSSSKNYSVGSYCTHDGKLYVCMIATSGGTWVANCWATSQLVKMPAIATIDNLVTFGNDTRLKDSGIAKENVALKGDIPYSLGTPIVIDEADVEPIDGNPVYYGAATLADRTANIVQVTAATALDELRITFPAATSGKVRDFGLRVEIGTGSAALAAPALIPVAPTGETIKIENADGTIPALADGTATAKGVTLLYFSENAPGVFVVKGEQVEEVA